MSHGNKTLAHATSAIVRRVVDVDRGHLKEHASREYQDTVTRAFHPKFLDEEIVPGWPIPSEWGLPQLFEHEEGWYPEEYEPGMAEVPVSQPLKVSMRSGTETGVFYAIYYDTMFSRGAKKWRPKPYSQDIQLQMMMRRYPEYLRPDNHYAAARWLAKMLRIYWIRQEIPSC